LLFSLSSYAENLDQLQRKKLIAKGDRVIVLTDILAGGKFIETVQVRIV